MRRSKQDAEKTKKQLIFAACEVFYREGVARATLEQIAREAGVTRGALYWHFDNKVDILDALFQEVMPGMHELKQRLEGLQADDYWQCMLQHYVNFMLMLVQDVHLRQFCTVMHLKCELTESNAQVVALLNRFCATWEADIEQVMAQAVVVKALDSNTDVKQTSQLLRCILTGILVSYLGDVEKKEGIANVDSPIPLMTHMINVLRLQPILKN